MKPNVCMSLLLLAALGACKDAPKPAITAAWRDDFERAAAGDDYLVTAPDAYRITGGELNVSGAYNHPMWLLRKLPRDAVIELDVKSRSAAGDIKVEAWGDGAHHAPSNAKVQYTSTGYVFIFGGWDNTASIIAKQSEHGKDVVTRKDRKVEPGRVYHWKIVRKGPKIDWFIDDLTTPFLSLDDAQPLEGEGHSYFAFSNWESDLWFDNLSITPL
jgi:hypothetical protein